MIWTSTTRALFTVFLAMMNYLAPGKDHTALAKANAEVVDQNQPLFRDDSLKLKTAGLLTAVEYRESGFNNEAVGDHGHSVCACQIYDGKKELLKNPKLCVETGFKMLLQSVKIDRENPVAFFARGPGYANEEAKRLSRDRVALAKRLVGQVVSSQLDTKTAEK